MHKNELFLKDHFLPVNFYGTKADFLQKHSFPPMRAKLVTYKGNMIKTRLLWQLTAGETMFSLATSESYYTVWHCPEAVSLSLQRLHERSCIALY